MKEHADHDLANDPWTRPSPAAPRFDRHSRADLDRLLRWRRDVRRFRSDSLPEDAFERLVLTACLAPSVGLSQPWRFVQVQSPSIRASVRTSFEHCNADALAQQAGERAALYARLKLAGLDEAPCQFAVFSDHATRQGHGLGRLTMPEALDYSAVMAIHTFWLAARIEGIGLGWVSILDPAMVTSALDVPLPWKLIGYFCMGYPVDQDDTPALEREGWQARCDPESVLFVR